MWDGSDVRVRWKIDFARIWKHIKSRNSSRFKLIKIKTIDRRNYHNNSRIFVLFLRKKRDVPIWDWKFLNRFPTRYFLSVTQVLSFFWSSIPWHVSMTLWGFTLCWFAWLRYLVTRQYLWRMILIPLAVDRRWWIWWSLQLDGVRQTK
jgi:hypothetical protein